MRSLFFYLGLGVFGIAAAQIRLATTDTLATMDTRLVQPIDLDQVVSVSAVNGDISLQVHNANNVLVRDAIFDTSSAEVDFPISTGFDGQRLYVLVNSAGVFGESTTVVAFDLNLNKIYETKIAGHRGRDLRILRNNEIIIGGEQIRPGTTTAGFAARLLANGAIAFNVNWASEVDFNSTVQEVDAVGNTLFAGGTIGTSMSLVARNLTTGAPLFTKTNLPSFFAATACVLLDIDAVSVHMVSRGVDPRNNAGRTFWRRMNHDGTNDVLQETNERMSIRDAVREGNQLFGISDLGVLWHKRADDTQQTARTGLANGNGQVASFNNRFVAIMRNVIQALNRTTLAVERTVTEPSTFQIRAAEFNGSRLHLAFQDQTRGVVKRTSFSDFSIYNGFPVSRRSLLQGRHQGSGVDEEGNLYVAFTAGNQQVRLARINEDESIAYQDAIISAGGFEMPSISEFHVGVGNILFWRSVIPNGNQKINVIGATKGSTGTEVWFINFTDDAQFLVEKMVLGPANELFLVGRTTDARLTIRRINPQNGATIWQQSYFLDPTNPTFSNRCRLADAVRLQSGNLAVSVLIDTPAVPNALGIPGHPNLVINGATGVPISVFRNGEADMLSSVLAPSDGDNYFQAVNGVRKLVEWVGTVATIKLAPIDSLVDVLVENADSFGTQTEFAQIFIRSGNSSTLVVGGSTPFGGLLLDSRQIFLSARSVPRGGALAPNQVSLFRNKLATGLFRGTDFFPIVGRNDLSIRGMSHFVQPDRDIWLVTEEALPSQGSSVTVRRFDPTTLPVVANADVFGAVEDVRLTVAAPGVLRNDTDPEDEPMTPVLVTGIPAGQGSVRLNPNGSFTYTPPLNFNGQTSFTYKARNAQGRESGPQTVTLNVAAANDAPTAVADTFTVRAGQRLLVPDPGVLANDTDIDGDTGLTAQLRQTVAAGTLTFSARGGFTFNAPATAQTVTFTYRVRDPGGLVSADQVVTINVTN